ncbi:MAG: hypothetical protein QOJ44_2056, partial [Acidimicrobiaceae bacterium]|nr:hypothetical protein [Acidimicrobiaceae bacterium]
WHALAASSVAVVVTVAALVVSTIAPVEGSVVIRGQTMTPAEHRDLAANAAFTTNPIRFLLLGDSVALTLGIGLSYNSRPRYGVFVNDQAPLGCDLDPTLQVNTSGTVSLATPGCQDWRRTWAAQVAKYRPQVAGLALGRWEVADHLYQGKWTHVGQPVWDRHLVAELTEGAKILSADGAKVVLFTMPYVDPSQESPNGSPFTENLPSRVDAYNKVVNEVGRANPGVVTVIDLNKMLDPHGHFAMNVGGVIARWSDGVHVSDAGGELVQPKILPTVAALGLGVNLAPVADQTGSGSGTSASSGAHATPTPAG